MFFIFLKNANLHWFVLISVNWTGLAKKTVLMIFNRA